MRESGARMRTAAEVAELLGVSRSTVIREIERGRLRASRVGTQIRLSDDDVREYLLRNKVVANA